MKSRNEVLLRARQLVDAELERRFVESERRLPRRCHYNHRQQLDVRPTVEGEPNQAYNKISLAGGQTIGLCMLGAVKVDGRWVVNDSDQEEAKWAGAICEDPIDAQRCPKFTPIQSKGEVQAQFREELSNAEWVSANMPELAALLWVLNIEAPPKLTWLQRLLVYFRRTRLEPLSRGSNPLGIYDEDLAP